jgi:hypothetical protein
MGLQRVAERGQGNPRAPLGRYGCIWSHVCRRRGLILGPASDALGEFGIAALDVVQAVFQHFVNFLRRARSWKISTRLGGAR